MSVHLASVIPIKKRRFPVIDYAPASPPRENPSVSGENNNTQPDLPDLSKAASSAAGVSSVENRELKTKAVESDENRELKPVVAESVENHELKPKVVESSTSSEATDDLKTKVSVLPVVEQPKQEVSAVSDPVIVKQEIASGLALFTGKQNVNVPLEPTKGLISALDHGNNGNTSGKSEKLDPASLGLVLCKEKPDKSNHSQLALTNLGNESSLVLSKEKPDISDNKLLESKNLGNESFANRSNWDLNTNIEEWVGSTSDGSSPHMCDFSKTRNPANVKPCLNNLDVKTRAAVVGLGSVKGEPTVSCQSSNSGSALVLHGLQNEPDDSLGLSLSVPYRGLDASVTRTFLSNKPDSAPIAAASLNTQNAAVNFASCRSVKLEPITEVSRTELSLTSSSSGMELSNSSSVKKEIVEKPNSGVASPSSISPQKLVDPISIKSELIHERNENVTKFENSVRRHQYVARIMQHQESTASSSAMNVPLMSPNSCPSKLSTCTELNSSGDQHQFSFHSEAALGYINKLNQGITGSVSHTSSQDGLGNVGKLTGDDSQKLELTQIDGHLSEICGEIEVGANDDERLNLSTEMLEDDTLGSDSESCEKQGVSTPPPGGQKLCSKEDGEYEEGEVRTPVQHSARENTFVDSKNAENVEVGECDPRNLQPFVLSGDQSTNTSDYDGKSAISETHSDNIKECVISVYEPISEENSSQKLADNLPERKVCEMRSISVTVEKRVDISRPQNAERGYGKMVTGDGLANQSNGTALVDKATDMVNKQICSARNETNLSMEAFIDNDAAKESTSGNNKSRIITLPRSTVLPSPYRTRPIPNRLLASCGGNKRYSDLDGDMQPRENRHEFYTDKFAKDSMRDSSSFRDSRPSFIRGRGRGRGRGGRFGPSHNDWDSENDFASGTYNGPSGYRGRRPKHTSFIPDTELEHRGYRRKTMNDEKFMGHLPDDTLDTPTYNRPQNMYEEYDGQLVREKRNFSTIHRKVYTGIDSKSPVRSRTRSPGPWPSRRRRSPEGHSELNQTRSPPVYRMRRMRSLERASYREEMVPRRRVSPSFITRSHSDDLRDVESLPEHVHPRSFSTNRRSPPARIFQRNARRDVIDSRERDDVNVEDRRKFVERRGGHNSSFRPSYSGDTDNFHFHQSEGPRPYRFCPDGDTEFAERSNMREREFDGRIKHQQPLVAPRRIRDIDEQQQQQDGTYRPGVRVWHDEGFNDASGPKRRRF